MLSPRHYTWALVSSVEIWDELLGYAGAEPRRVSAQLGSESPFQGEDKLLALAQGREALRVEPG